MKYAEFFSMIKGQFMGADVSDVKEGQLFVEPYEYYDRDAIFICEADTLMKIADGKLDPILAVTLQKLRVEGNIDKALKFKELVDKKKNKKK